MAEGVRLSGQRGRTGDHFYPLHGGGASRWTSPRVTAMGGAGGRHAHHPRRERSDGRQRSHRHWLADWLAVALLVSLLVSLKPMLGMIDHTEVDHRTVWDDQRPSADRPLVPGTVPETGRDDPGPSPASGRTMQSRPGQSLAPGRNAAIQPDPAAPIDIRTAARLIPTARAAPRGARQRRPTRRIQYQSIASPEDPSFGAIHRTPLSRISRGRRTCGRLGTWLSWMYPIRRVRY